jgi:outer membrane protein OmpA-like peptidoglycan-associated protein
MKLKITFASLVVIVQALTAQPLNNPAFDNPAFVNANTVYDELNPVISPDGKLLYVTVANHPQNIGGKKDPGDIWISGLGPGNVWAEPVHGGALINDRGYNSIAGFSSDGSEMFLLNHFDSQGGTPRTQGISVTQRSGDLWARPTNISIPYFQNKGNLLSGFITPDKRYFVFSAETYGSRGVEDLYITERNVSGKWSEPKNLGGKINTQFQELSPTLSADGNTLYFSSNGRKGSGSFDVYSATRLDESWTNWSEPVNLGPGVNTEGRDLFYRSYANRGFSLYTSTKNSDGYGDVRIQTLTMPVEEVQPQKEEVIAEIEDTISTHFAVVPPSEGTEHEVKVHGKVINAKTGEPIDATISFEPLASTNVSAETATSTSTGYSVTLGTDAVFKVKIESNGYISTIENLDVKTYEMKDLEMNFNLQPIEVGATVNLRDVLFEQSKTVLLPQSYSQLDLVVSFLKTNSKVSIELAGHTDNVGNPLKNTKLSQERVNAVKTYLVSKGIDSDRVTGKGYGGSKPIASNNAEDTRKLNRRVEFTIRKN